MQPFAYWGAMAYSGQRRIAFETGFNDALFGRDRNNPYDQDTVGGSYQAYEEGYELGSISEQPPRGPKGDQGDPGVQGPPGSSGVNGSDGANGTSIYTSNGAPGAGLGLDGDVYIDADNGDIYEKSGGSWGLQGSPGIPVAQAIKTDTIDPTVFPEITYKGEAAAGSLETATVWRISRLTFQSDGDTTVEWADGNTNYDNRWDQRLSLTYS